MKFTGTPASRFAFSLQWITSVFGFIEEIANVLRENEQRWLSF
jgi:hypothetical protein